MKSTSVGRYLTVFDGESEELEELYELQHFDLAKFLEVFDVSPDTDPEMLDRYVVGPDEVSFLSAYLKESVEFDFARCGYFVEALLKE